MPPVAKRYRMSDDQFTNEPGYDRVARGLTDAELEDEILGGRGLPEYQAALLAEADRRGQAPPVAS